MLQTKIAVPVQRKVTLQHFFEYCSKNNLPFAYYRLPDEQKIKVIAQNTSRVNYVPPSGAENICGFIFSPFKVSVKLRQIIILPSITSEENNLPELTFAKSKPVTVSSSEQTVKQTNRIEFEALVSNIKKKIKSGVFSKIVAARVISKKKLPGFNAVKFYKSLCQKYPHAFVSLVNITNHGLWIGASPEILAAIDDTEIKTYSLAGTQVNENKKTAIKWGDKEIDEQRIVSNYILDSFSKITNRKPVINGPETVSAGNLLHLRTTFTYPNTRTLNWNKVVNILHPTPAVAGFPKEKAINFITKNEKSPRSFYSGYLGPVNLDKATYLFVNLRCMQVLENSLAVYVGCGITADSNAHDEWNETEAKSQTLLALLK